MYQGGLFAFRTDFLIQESSTMILAYSLMPWRLMHILIVAVEKQPFSLFPVYIMVLSSYTAALVWQLVERPSIYSLCFVSQKKAYL